MRRGSEGPAALQLVEEAVQLLRLAPPLTLALHVASVAPFAVGLLFFWARATWFAPDDAVLAWWGLGLAGLFVWMKTGQALFVRRLEAQHAGRPARPLPLRLIPGLAARQLRLHASGLFVLPAALAAGLPFGWAYAYYQNVSALAASEKARGGRLHEIAWTEAARWPRQNHVGLLFLLLFALFVWINIAAGLVFVPWLLNRMLGVETVFGFSGWSLLNSTFVAVVTMLTWMALDPLVKAFYFLRCFHGSGWRTGADLRLELTAARRARAASRVAAALAAALVLSVPAVPAGRAAEASVAAQPSTDPRQLERALAEALQQPEFQWRLRPLPRPAGESEGWLRSFLRQGMESVQEMFRAIRRLYLRVSQWLDGLFPQREASLSGDAVGRTDWPFVLRLVSYALIGGILVLLAWVGWTVWRRGRASRIEARAVAVPEIAAPDLRDESLLASQLPEAGWLALAKEKAAAGEWRLALRALYLARLARLASEGMVQLARFKTNRDYENELRRRARQRTGLAEAFRGHRRQFEDVWYGSSPADPAVVRAWMDEFGPRAAS